MKMKEQNTYLSFLSFVQLIFMATAGAFANELFKTEKNTYTIVASFLFAIVTSIYISKTYRKVFRETRTRKKKRL